MITIGILAILATIAAPSFGKQLAQKRTQKGAMEIMAVFKEARSSAALTNQPVTLTISDSNKRYEVKLGSDVRASYKLDDKLAISTDVSGNLTTLPTGMIQGDSTYYFRVCDEKVSDIQGYSVWVNSRGVIKSNSGPGPDDNDIVKKACGT